MARTVCFVEDYRWWQTLTPFLAFCAKLRGGAYYAQTIDSLCERLPFVSEELRTTGKRNIAAPGSMQHSVVAASSVSAPN